MLKEPLPRVIYTRRPVPNEGFSSFGPGRFVPGDTDFLAGPQSIWAHQFGGPGRFLEAKLTDLYREPSISTSEKSANSTRATSLGHHHERSVASFSREPSTLKLEP